MRKDVSTVRPDPSDPTGKQMHVVETLDVLDVGTSVLLDTQVHPQFTAQTALEGVVETFRTHGLPTQITLDRDTRWVGSPQGSDFPSALVRLFLCLGVQIQVCDPHHPQQNGFVERFHRTRSEKNAWQCPIRRRWNRRVRSRSLFKSITMNRDLIKPSPVAIDLRALFFLHCLSCLVSRRGLILMPG